MHPSVIFAVLLAVAVSAKNVPSTIVGRKINDITMVDDIRNYARSHPGAKIIPFVKEQGKARTQSVRYTLGGRISGDSLVAQGTDTFSYETPNDVSLQLNYPESGTAAVLTYVEIIAIQNNDSGNAYVVEGGIGQRKMVLVIECKETDYFSYKAQFFGTD